MVMRDKVKKFFEVKNYTVVPDVPSLQVRTKGSVSGGKNRIS